MLLFSSATYPLPLPPGHRFPMTKYGLLHRAVQSAGLVDPSRLRPADPATDEELLRVHEPAYLERVKSGALDSAELRRLGFPWSPRLVERSRRSVGGTVGACRAAVDSGGGVNLAGGTHHAFADRGEGFCVFNDVAVAIRSLQAEQRIERVVIVDCDVHQGNGTARIFASDPSVFTFSIHGRRNYPLRKETSDLDVELEDGCGDRDYLSALDRALDRLPIASADVVVYLAGADPFAGDRLGRLAVSAAGLEERDRRVLERCRQAGTPVAVAMAGGYAEPVEEIVRIHLRTVALAVNLLDRSRIPISPERGSRSS